MNASRALVGCCIALALVTGCASEHAAPATESAAKAGPAETVSLTDQVVEAGCAQCMFGLKIDDCETAIRVDGKVYLALGTCVPDAEEHGSGLCHAILKARVSGKLVGDKFMATSFTLLP